MSLTKNNQKAKVKKSVLIDIIFYDNGKIKLIFYVKKYFAHTSLMKKNKEAYPSRI